MLPKGADSTDDELLPNRCLLRDRVLVLLVAEPVALGTRRAPDTPVFVFVLRFASLELIKSTSKYVKAAYTQLA